MTGLERILVVAAHPDDEVLGCGGTIAHYVSRGHSVDITFVADGVAARKRGGAAENKRRRSSAMLAAAILGAKEPRFLDFPDQELDTAGLLKITQAIEMVAFEIQPTIIYTHHAGDLNEDHRQVSNAVLTAARPLPGQSVRAIYGFEVLSSSEWRFGSPASVFDPSRFVDVSLYLSSKLEALRAYDEEMRDFPHARSYKAAEALCYLRGAQVGLEAAEAFSTYRDVVR